MKLLLIDLYSDNKLGREEFHIFYGILHNILQTENNITITDIEIITKKYNNLEDYIVDWEYPSLLSNSLNNSKNFDLIDIVCISGDLKILPWNSNCYQLITLIHMCNMLGKPLLTCGSGTHIAIYTCSTQGIRYQLLNLPIGDKIENIKTQSTYFKGPNGYTCGWLDYETGDIYNYDNHLHHWNPVCNIGMYRLAQTGTPTPARFRPIKKKFEMEDRIASSHIPDTPGDHDGLLVIRKNQHKYYGFNSFQSFTLSFHLMDDWQFNVDGALPLHTGLEILADGPHGPAIFKYSSYSLYIASRVTTHHICEDIRMIIRNYFRYIFQQFRKLNTLGRSCYDFLYVEHNGGLNEAEKLSKLQSPPLSTIPIRTKVKGGPKLISSPITEIYETQVFPTADVSHIIGPPKIGTIRQYKQQYRDPYRMKHVRLKQVFELCYGQNKCQELNNLAKSSMKQNDNDNENDNNIEINNNNNNQQKSQSRSNSPLYSKTKSQLEFEQNNQLKPSSPPKSSKKNNNNNNNNSNNSDEINQKLNLKKLNQNTKNIRYVAYNRTMIAEENIRRQQSELKQHKNTTHPSKRMNWKSDWQTVRGLDKNSKLFPYGNNYYDDDDHDEYDYNNNNNNNENENDDDNNDNNNEDYNNGIIDKQSKNISTLEDEARLSFIPMIHPLSRPSTVGNIKNSTYSHTSLSNNEIPPKPVSITRIRPKSAVGTSSWLQNENLLSNDNHQKNEYEGIFRGGYLTPYEKERKEYMKSKSKFISNTFKTYSGIASEMPLRDSGGIIFDGPYPAPIESNKDLTKVGYYGAWKPTKDLYNHQPS